MIKKYSKVLSEYIKKTSRVYLDNNATTPLDKRVLNKMMPYLKTIYSNPSSIYNFAQISRKAVEDARQSLAKLLSAEPEEIIFTAGGTESVNTAIKGIAFYLKDKGNHIITSKIEHQAVLNTCKFLEKFGFEIVYLNVDNYGRVDIEELKKNIRDDTILVSIMYANNEVGTLQPIKEIAEICKEKGIYFHTDAVQAAGKVSINVKELGVDLLSLSAHKFYGPKGAGALYIRKGITFHSLLHGGSQENHRRGGTENVSDIAGLGMAADILMEEMNITNKGIKVLRDSLELGIKERIPDVLFNGHKEFRLDNTSHICIKYVEGENLLINLDFEGICVSAGSACTSGSLEPSHVLLAMGIPSEIARSSLRFSLGKYTKKYEIDKVLKVLPPIVKKLREVSSSWNK